MRWPVRPEDPATKTGPRGGEGEEVEAVIVARAKTGAEAKAGFMMGIDWDWEEATRKPTLRI